MDEFQVGDKIRFVPQSGNRWWTIRALDDRYVIATAPAPFVSDSLYYTVVDLNGWTFAHDGVGHSIVRSSLNTLGGGYDVGPNGEKCGQMLKELNDHLWQLSHRRMVRVEGIEIQP